MPSPARYFDKTTGEYVGPTGLLDHLATLEKQHGLPSNALSAVLYAETPATVQTSSAGAQGPFQLKPILRKQYKAPPEAAHDPYLASEIAATELSKQSRDLGGFLPALAAWNWGRQNLRNMDSFSPDKPLDTATLPPTVQDFITKVLRSRVGFRPQHPPEKGVIRRVGGLDQVGQR
jgi:hypothetical protein